MSFAAIAEAEPQNRSVTRHAHGVARLLKEGLPPLLRAGRGRKTRGSE
jgi:hypothetical protein